MNNEQVVDKMKDTNDFSSITHVLNCFTVR